MAGAAAGSVSFRAPRWEGVLRGREGVRGCGGSIRARSPSFAPLDRCSLWLVISSLSFSFRVSSRTSAVLSMHRRGVTRGLCWLLYFGLYCRPVIPC